MNLWSGNGPTDHPVPMTIWSRIPHGAVKRRRPSGRLTPLYKYLVWGRGDSSFIENRSLAAVEP